MSTKATLVCLFLEMVNNHVREGHRRKRSGPAPADGGVTLSARNAGRPICCTAPTGETRRSADFDPAHLATVGTTTVTGASRAPRGQSITTSSRPSSGSGNHGAYSVLVSSGGV